MYVPYIHFTFPVLLAAAGLILWVVWRSQKKKYTAFPRSQSEADSAVFDSYAQYAREWFFMSALWQVVDAGTLVFSFGASALAAAIAVLGQDALFSIILYTFLSMLFNMLQLTLAPKKKAADYQAAFHKLDNALHTYAAGGGSQADLTTAKAEGERIIQRHLDD